MVACTTASGAIAADNSPDLRQPITTQTQTETHTYTETTTETRTQAATGSADPEKTETEKLKKYEPAKIKHDRWIAYRLAKYNWLDKVAEADPRIIEAITSHPGPAKVLAKHRHLDKIAATDHYLCRRLTRWKGATQELVRNPYFDVVAAYDPAGIYYAMNRSPITARRIARLDMFNQLPNYDRDFTREMSLHIK